MLRGGKRECIWGMFGKIRDVKTKEDLGPFGTWIKTLET